MAQPMTDSATTEPADGTEAPKTEAKPPTRLILVRHAVTAHTGPLLSGRMPGIDLSEKGVGQAEAAATRLAALPIAAVYASPIERTTQTARYIAAHLGLEVLPLPGVIEADYGDWTGGKIADLAKTDEWKVVQAAPSRAQFPGGESIRAMQARMVDALDAVVAAHPHETVVVVSHADPIKSAIAHYTGMHLDLFQRLHVSPASATVLDFHAYGVLLVKCNDTGGLADLLPEPESEARSRDRRNRVRSRRRDRRGRVRRARRAHVRDPGAQGCGDAVGARREGAGALLANEAEQFLDRIAEEHPEEPGTFGELAGSGAVEEDEPLFRARLIGIGFDPERSLVLLELREQAADDDEPPPAVEESEGHVARLYATRAQIRAMLANGIVAVSAGRPKCPLCDFPMDPDGHICPRMN